MELKCLRVLDKGLFIHCISLHVSLIRWDTNGLWFTVDFQASIDEKFRFIMSTRELLENPDEMVEDGAVSNLQWTGIIQVGVAVL